MHYVQELCLELEIDERHDLYASEAQESIRPNRSEERQL